jgi:hypothetical protein
MSLRNTNVELPIVVNAFDLMLNLASELSTGEAMEFLIEFDDSIGDEEFTTRAYEYFKSIIDRWERQDNA